MRTRSVAAAVLFLAPAVACGSRSDVSGSPVATPDEAGSLTDANAAADAGSAIDARVDADAATCNRTLNCSQALTCIDGMRYPTTCGPSNCDPPIGSCTASGGAANADGGGDAASCTIVAASNYDQSCTVDSDCVSVGQVLGCPANACAGCPTATINRGALAQYTADFSAATRSAGGVTIDGARVPAWAFGQEEQCACAAASFPCCRSGMCTQECPPVR